jgi:hypothetical protein
MKAIKYWRTEPLDKQCTGLWSGYHNSEEEAVQYIIDMLTNYGMTYDEFEVLPYYVIDID